MEQHTKPIQSKVSLDSHTSKRKVNQPKLSWVLCGCVGVVFGLFTGNWASAAEESSQIQGKVLSTVQEFAQAVAKGDTIAAGQRDFICLFKMQQEKKIVDGQFPAQFDPVYDWCAQRRSQAHERAIQQSDRALDAVWPGKGKLVDFSDFQRFFISETGNRELAPSFFVMPQIAALQPTAPFSLEGIKAAPLPHASFRYHDSDPVLATPTTLLTTTVSYPNPNTSPVSNAKGTKDWVVPYKKPQGVIKSVKVNWVVLSDLKKLGFPTDTAVLDIPLDGPHGTNIPFVLEAGGYVPKSTVWWGPGEAPEALQEAVDRANNTSDYREALMLLNRVLLVNPKHQGALEAFSNKLYQGLLAYGERIHGVQIANAQFSRQFNELYWTVQSQSDRFDISLDMEMGGKSEPMPADYLYRMIPVMEALSSLQPGDFENRLRLGIAYRWTNDQMPAISTPQILLTEVPSEQKDLRARILLELAWSRISKVGWNRVFDDPDLTKGYQEAEQALQLSDDPMVKFSAAYAKAFSYVFRVPLDNKAVLDHLTKARRWFDQLPDANPDAWAFLLQNDTMKGFVDTDPSFKALLASR